MVKKVHKNYLVFIFIFVSQWFIINYSYAKINVVENFQTPDDVAFFDEKGNKHFLDEFEDKTVLIVFWATWCAPCIKEIPELDILQKDFRKLPFKILAISQDFQGIKVVKEYFEKHEIKYLEVYHDYQNQLFKAFSVSGLPTSFLINTDGKIVFSFNGVIDWFDDEIRKIILSHIPGNPVEPKNSYKVQDLNNVIKPFKSSNEPTKANDKETAEKNLKENIETETHPNIINANDIPDITIKNIK